MRAQFYRPDDPDRVLAEVRYVDGSPEIRSNEDRTLDALARVFRPTPVAIDDPAFRQAGTSGPAVVPPGSALWFQAAARVRGSVEGLAVRFVPEADRAMGWDPAGAYRSFTDALVRRIGVGEPGPLSSAAGASETGRTRRSGGVGGQE